MKPQKRVEVYLHSFSALDGVGGQRQAPAALLPGKRPDTRCTKDWLGPRACMDIYGKPGSHRDWIPDSSSPQRVSIPTELCKPTVGILVIFHCERQEGVWEKGGVGSPILKLASRWRGLVSFKLQPPYSQGQCPWYSLSRRLIVFQKCSEQFGVSKKIYGPCLIDNHCSSDMYPFAYLGIPELTVATCAGYSRIRNQRQQNVTDPTLQIAPELNAAQICKKFPAFCGTTRLSTEITKAATVPCLEQDNWPALTH